jgi:hypothetical protein
MAAKMKWGTFAATFVATFPAFFGRDGIQF